MNELQYLDEGNLSADSLNFNRLNDIQCEEFDVAMKIYTSAFPLSERHPTDVIRERIKTGKTLIYIGRFDEHIVFMALLWPLKHTRFILLDYMAIDSVYRGKGIGSYFLRYMHETLKVNNQFFILEVENPGFGENLEEREKRIQFYRNNGAKELKNVRYLLPPLHGTIPTEMILMIFPALEQRKLRADLVRKLIIQIYKELYDRDQSDPLLISTLSNIISDIDLV